DASGKVTRLNIDAFPFMGTERVPFADTPSLWWTLLDAWLVSDALAALSPDHRAVVVRSYYQGQSTAEIAEALEIPDGTVKSRLHYALRALRLILQEQGVTR
ncbi:MAG: sigma-70 family RNA polymerase sigma factor, partial [Lacisediminihabitans sp.]